MVVSCLKEACGEMNSHSLDFIAVTSLILTVDLGFLKIRVFYNIHLYNLGWSLTVGQCPPV